MKTTKVYKKLIKAIAKGYEFIALKGGARSSKTWSIIQALIFLANIHKDEVKPFIISVFGMTVPHLKGGPIRDFKAIMGLQFDKKMWNSTDRIYHFGNAVIEFVAIDSWEKTKGPARNIAYFNEANHIPYEVYRQADTRTEGLVIIDWNPNSEFWFEKHVMHRPGGVRIIHSTYKDNNYLSKKIVRAIESFKDDKDYWRVYGLGLTGSRMGCCLTNWSVCDVLPDYYVSRTMGLDFGFAGDPSALVDVYLAEATYTYEVDGIEQVGVRYDIWLDEVLYAQHLTTTMLDEEMIIRGVPHNMRIIADNNNLLAVEELRVLGWNIEPISGTNKGAGSVVYGLDILKRYHIHVTSRSTNIIRELKAYKWKINRMTGEPMNVPDKDKHVDHSIDAARYVAITTLGVQYSGGVPSLGTSEN